MRSNYATNSTAQSTGFIYRKLERRKQRQMIVIDRWG